MPYLFRLYLKCIIEKRIRNMNLLLSAAQEIFVKDMLVSDIAETTDIFYTNATSNGKFDISYNWQYPNNDNDSLREPWVEVWSGGTILPIFCISKLPKIF